MQPVHDRAVGAVRELLAAPGEPPVVEAVRREAVRGHVGDHRDDHQRGDDAVIVRHVEDHEDRGERRARRPGDEPRHPDDPPHLGVHRVTGHEAGGEAAEPTTEGGADEQRRREDAAGAAGAEGDRRRDDLREGERDERVPREVAGPEHLGGDGEVAVAEEEAAREQRDRADGEPADHRAHPGRRPRARKVRRGREEEARVERRAEAAGDAEERE